MARKPVWTGFLVLAGGLAAAAVAAPDAARAVWLDVWESRSARAAIAAEKDRAGRLTDVHADVQTRCEFRARLVDELTAGRVPLAQAADALLAANRDRPDWLTAVRLFYPDGPNDKARAARVLVKWVRAQTQDDPDRQVEALPRLEAELADLVGVDG